MKQKSELPETLTIDAYRDWRRDGLLDYLAAVGAALLRSCFPVLIIDEVIREFPELNAAVRGMTVFLIIPGMVLLLLWIQRKMVCRISYDLKEIAATREVCLRSISDKDART